MFHPLLKVREGRSVIVLAMKGSLLRIGQNCSRIFLISGAATSNVPMIREVSSEALGLFWPSRSSLFFDEACLYASLRTLFGYPRSPNLFWRVFASLLKLVKFEQFLLALRYWPLGIPRLRAGGWKLSQRRRELLAVGLRKIIVSKPPVVFFVMRTSKKQSSFSCISYVKCRLMLLTFSLSTNRVNDNLSPCQTIKISSIYRP